MVEALTKLSPQAKTEQQEGQAWRQFVACLQSNDTKVITKAWHDLLITMSCNEFKRELATFFKEADIEPLSIERANNELDCFCVATVGSDRGYLFWQLPEFNLPASSLASWLGAYAERQKKVAKGRKQKVKRQAKAETGVCLYRYKTNVYAKRACKNPRHLLTVRSLLELLRTKLRAKMAKEAQATEVLLALLDEQTELLKNSLTMAMLDFEKQLKASSSLEHSVQQLRQADLVFVKLIKLYLLALKFGA